MFVSIRLALFATLTLVAATTSAHQLVSRADTVSYARNCTLDSAHLAKTADCQALLASKDSFSKTFTTEETCAYITDPGYVHSHKTNVVSCNVGCCIGVATPFKDAVHIDAEKVRGEASALLQHCIDYDGTKEQTSAKKLYRSDNHGICLLEPGAGCGCYDSLSERKRARDG